MTILWCDNLQQIHMVQELEIVWSFDTQYIYNRLAVW